MMQTHADKNHDTPASADLKRQRGDESAFHISNNRPEAIAQRQLLEMANDSPRAKGLQAAQQLVDTSPRIRESIGLTPRSRPFDASSGTTAQLESAPEEEEMLQGRFATMQREALEEEELLQGKFAAVQRQGPEEEEMLQGRFATMQREVLEEEEPLQGKFDAVQRQVPEDEEMLQGRFATMQREALEEEELLQGKFAAVQRQGPEEEEMLQGRFATIQREVLEEEEPLQGKFAAVQRQAPEEDELQMKRGRSDAPAQLEADPATRSNDTGLPDNLKSGIESLSGMSLDNVTVHYNSSQPAQLNALAYAQGTDIHVAPGQEQHLPHEAWHVVQQARGRVKPTMQMKGGVPVNDDESLEREADEMGARALQLREADALASASSAQAMNSERREAGLVQKVPVSNKGMTDSGFSKHRGDEWIWWNTKGAQPNHVSAIRTGDDVKKIHAKTEYKGGKVNRIDWNDSGAGEFNGPTTTLKQAPDHWDSWLPDATQAGNVTINLFKSNKKTGA